MTTNTQGSGARGRGRAISFGTVLKMHAAYRTPLSMREVGRRFGIGKSAVARAFRDWNLAVRTVGGLVGQVRAKPVRASEPIVFRPPPALKTFCGQCERRVAAAESASCTSRFCKAMVAAA